MPTFVGGSEPECTGVIYFNGDNGKLVFPMGDSARALSRPIPKRLSFQSVIKGNEVGDVFIVNFDEIETLQAFSKLGGNKEKLDLKIELSLPKTNTRVTLCNDKECVLLARVKVGLL